jgi:hypothetical protein
MKNKIDNILEQFHKGEIDLIEVRKELLLLCDPMYMYNKDYKIGDITPDGWEVISVNYTPQYTMRKRIIITTDYNNLKGVLGYCYFLSNTIWIETDDGKILKLREDEFEYV